MPPSSPTASVVADAGAVTQVFFGIVDTELNSLAELQVDKHSANTRRAYAQELADFFQAVAVPAPTP